MFKKFAIAGAVLAVPLFVMGCATDGTNGTGSSSPAMTDSGSTTSASSTPASSDGGGFSPSDIPSLINVDLRNVLNDLSVRLNIDRANVPVTIQLPITLAANVCGVSVNVLSASTGSKGTCTANTTSPELAQVVQQQMAAGGSVGGGAQGGSTATTGTSSPTAGQASGGSTGTGGTSTGMTDTTNQTPTTP